MLDDSAEDTLVVGMSSSFMLQDAIDDACAQLKQKLRSDHVFFRIGDIRGEAGGFTDVRRLEVHVFGSAVAPTTTRSI